METKTYQVYKFKELSPEAQEKAIENWRNNHSAQDTFYAQDEGILYTKGIVGYEIFKNVMPKYWSVGYGHMWAQFDLEIKDLEKFKKAFKLSTRLYNKLDISFSNSLREQNTELDISLLCGETLTTLQEKKIEKAKEIFENLMHEAVSNLNRAYEWEFSEEHIKEEIEANDYNFLENGEID